MRLVLPSSSNRNHPIRFSSAVDSTVQSNVDHQTSPSDTLQQIRGRHWAPWTGVAWTAFQGLEKWTAVTSCFEIALLNWAEQSQCHAEYWNRWDQWKSRGTGLRDQFDGHLYSATPMEWWPWSKQILNRFRKSVTSKFPAVIGRPNWAPSAGNGQRPDRTCAKAAKAKRALLRDCRWRVI